MDHFLARRMNDGRYRLNVTRAPSTAATSWYESTEFANFANGSTSVILSSNGSVVRHNSSKPYSEAKKRELESRDTSDGSDGGPCWSDYERVPGTEAGEKGSCRPKKAKKAKEAKKDAKKEAPAEESKS